MPSSDIAIGSNSYAGLRRGGHFSCHCSESLEGFVALMRLLPAMLTFFSREQYACRHRLRLDPPNVRLCLPAASLSHLRPTRHAVLQALRDPPRRPLCKPTAISPRLCSPAGDAAASFPGRLDGAIALEALIDAEAHVSPADQSAPRTRSQGSTLPASQVQSSGDQAAHNVPNADRCGRQRLITSPPTVRHD